MWHLVRRNRVRNGRDIRSETRRMRSTKVALLKIPMDNVQYNTKQRGINDDTDDEHGVCVAETACWVGVLCADSMNTFYRNFQKCKFWWTSFVCFGPSIAAISYKFSTHKVSHSWARLWQQNVSSCECNKVVSAFWSFYRRSHFVFKFLLFFIVFRCLISFISMELLWVQAWSKA